MSPNLGGMVNGKCMDPPGMGCNNENWGKGAQDVTTSVPIDKENMPQAMKGYNLTEFAEWVNGDISEGTGYKFLKCEFIIDMESLVS